MLGRYRADHADDELAELGRVLEPLVGSPQEHHLLHAEGAGRGPLLLLPDRGQQLRGQ